MVSDTGHGEFSSTAYWQRRYRRGGNSGAGSYGRLAQYKADYVNHIVRDYGISRVVEFGCGDSNQASLYSFPAYLGLDVAPSAVEICEQKLGSRPNWQFKLLDGTPIPKHDMAMSIDVIFHLVEDDVYDRYMRSLFDAAESCVLIYSSDKDDPHPAKHVRHRSFSDWIAENQPDWVLVDSPEHPFPLKEGLSEDAHSFAAFKLYLRRHRPAGKIRAHLATFPPRRGQLEAVVENISRQVDELFLVLNEYDDIPDFIQENKKVKAVIPETDLKDTGKFYFPADPDDVVFFVDDDVNYPADFVDRSLALAGHVGLEKTVFGYHCSIYADDLKDGAKSRQVTHISRKNPRFLKVDQIATNAMIGLGRNVAPFSYMQSSQKFVDVRYAKWLFEHDIQSVMLPRAKNYITEINSKNAGDVTIYKSFTRNSPQHVIDEIKSFAGKSRQIGRNLYED